MSAKPVIPRQNKEKSSIFSDAALVGEGGFEPPKALPADLQSVPFGHSGIPPYSVALGAGGRTRTPDLLITNQLLYRLSYTSILTGTHSLVACSAPERLVIIANHIYFVKQNFQEKRKFCKAHFKPYLLYLYKYGIYYNQTETERRR